MKFRPRLEFGESDEEDDDDDDDDVFERRREEEERRQDAAERRQDQKEERQLKRNKVIWATNLKRNKFEDRNIYMHILHYMQGDNRLRRAMYLHIRALLTSPKLLPAYVYNIINQFLMVERRMLGSERRNKEIERWIQSQNLKRTSRGQRLMQRVVIQGSHTNFVRGVFVRMGQRLTHIMKNNGAPETILDLLDVFERILPNYTENASIQKIRAMIQQAYEKVVFQGSTSDAIVNYVISRMKRQRKRRMLNMQFFRVLVGLVQSSGKVRVHLERFYSHLSDADRQKILTNFLILPTSFYQNISSQDEGRTGLGQHIVVALTTSVHPLPNHTLRFFRAMNQHLKWLEIGDELLIHDARHVTRTKKRRRDKDDDEEEETKVTKKLKHSE